MDYLQIIKKCFGVKSIGTCLNNWLLSFILMAPKRQEISCEPMILATGLLFASIQTFLTRES